VRAEAEIIIFLIGGGVFFLLGFCMLFVQLYLSYFKMNEILISLARSRAALGRRFIVGWDPFTRFFMLVSIAPLLMFPQRAIKLGELDQEDYLAFSPKLLRAIKCFYYLAHVGAAVLIALCCLSSNRDK
jgi:hypothetical protein